jgi:hypothetical protein
MLFGAYKEQSFIAVRMENSNDVYLIDPNYLTVLLIGILIGWCWRGIHRLEKRYFQATRDAWCYLRNELKHPHKNTYSWRIYDYYSTRSNDTFGDAERHGLRPFFNRPECRASPTMGGVH